MKNRKIKLITFFSLFFLFVFLSPFFLFAQERALEVEYPKIGGIKPETVATGLPEYVKYVFNFAVSFFGFVVLGALLWGGFLYLTSIGNPTKIKEAKDRIVSAFLGLIILFSSYIVFTNINPQLVIFSFPPLTPTKKTEAPKGISIKPTEINLIATELPLGQSIENGVWQKERRTAIENLMKEDENFLNQKIKVDDKELDRIADLNKYLRGLTEDCRCEVLKGLCTKPKDYAQPVGCTGDPCPEETRKKIDKILKIFQEKQDKILEFQKKIIVKKLDFENQLSIFQSIEQEMLSCETQQKQLFNLNEHLSRLNYFREQGWKVQTVTVPGAPKSQADPLTFYCTAGGNILDYPYISSKDLPSEFAVPELYVKEDTEGLQELPKISCPAEIPLGEVVDELRESAVLLLTKLEKLADLHQKLAFDLKEMTQLISQCNDKNCKMNCGCVPNPCYEPICGTPPTRVNKCGTGRCTKPTPYTPNICYIFCDSPCLQAVGGCAGFCPIAILEKLNKKIEDCLKKNCPLTEMQNIYQEVEECSDACPRAQIIFTTGDIKVIENEIFKTIAEIKQIFPKASSLLADETNPKNLKNLRAGMDICYSPNIQEPTWFSLDCATAVGNYGPSGEIIGSCHPRNFFCCTLSEEKIQFPWKAEVSKEPAAFLASKTFTPLPEGEKGCPAGWICDPDVKKYNQYKDASQPLKELISCMRTSLDKIQKEKEIKGTIGRISSISDSKIYQGTCVWEAGPTTPGGCSHDYYVKYKKEIVSAHYGGPLCRFERKSYAMDLGDEENASYLIEAAKACRPDVYINFRTPGHYDHLHVSIGQAEDCGNN